MNSVNEIELSKLVGIDIIASAILIFWQERKQWHALHKVLDHVRLKPFSTTFGKMFYQLNNQYVVKQQYNCCTYVPHSLVFIPVKIIWLGL